MEAKNPIYALNKKKLKEIADLGERMIDLIYLKKKITEKEYSALDSNPNEMIPTISSRSQVKLDANEFPATEVVLRQRFAFLKKLKCKKLTTKQDLIRNLFKVDENLIDIVIEDIIEMLITMQVQETNNITSSKDNYLQNKRDQKTILDNLTRCYFEFRGIQEKYSRPIKISYQSSDFRYVSFVKNRLISKFRANVSSTSIRAIMDYKRKFSDYKKIHSAEFLNIDFYKGLSSLASELVDEALNSALEESITDLDFQLNDLVKNTAKKITDINQAEVKD